MRKFKKKQNLSVHTWFEIYVVCFGALKRMVLYNIENLHSLALIQDV
jgi:hypothetical protein